VFLKYRHRPNIIEGQFMMNVLGNHLWQSTLFAVAAAVLALFFRKNNARVRCWIWLAASAKFLIPFSLFIAVGSALDFNWRHSASVTPQTTFTYIENISQPFGMNSSSIIPEPAKPDQTDWIAMALFSAWLGGFSVVSLLYLIRGRRLRMALGRSKPLTGGRACEVLRSLERNSGLNNRIKLACSDASLEPGVFGVFRPMLLLPEGMIERLSNSELEAIIAHEIAHVCRHDNLISALHMFSEALFWFHPMIWWLGARLIEDRERACDEEVLRLGKNPQSYAEGILKICEFYLESRFACFAGVTGGDIKKRIQTIMAHRIGGKLSSAKRFILAMAGIVALFFPIAVGLFKAPSSQAQSQTGLKPSFEVTSIKIAENCGNVRPGVNLKIPLGPSYQPGGRYFTCSQLKWIMMEAYQLDPFSPPTGGPGWIEDTLFQIEAKAEGNPGKDEMRLMVQSLLEERFKLRMHREVRKAPVYLLVTAKSGPKLQPAKDAQGNPITSLPSAEDRQKIFNELIEGKSPNLADFTIPGNYSIAGKSSGHEFTGRAMTMGKLADALFSIVGRRKVVDQTGLAGFYDFKLVYANPYRQQGTSSAADPNPATEPSAPVIFTAIQEQLGLRLVPDKAPLECPVIDHVEKPSEN
jgi:bla regulator protein blaR1